MVNASNTMNKRTLLFRNLFYYRRINAATITGMAIAVAVIVGALAVGDSVKNSLLNLVWLRLGLTEYALISQENLFNANLANKIAETAEVKTAPVLLLSGMAATPQGNLRANQVNIIGIDQNFSQFSLQKTNLLPSSDQAIINQELANRLELKPGSEFILRLAKPDLLPGDVPLLSGNDNILSFRITVKAIADDSFPGNFSFRSSQLAPANIFLPLEWLAQKTGQAGNANVIIARGGKPAELTAALEKVWTLTDVGFKSKTNKDGVIDLKYEKIFIPENISGPAIKIPGAEGILTYFVNNIGLTNENGEIVRSTPYSFVAGIQTGLDLAVNDKNQEIEPDEIVLNQWLAEDLKAKTGDKILLEFFIPGPMRQLVEKNHSFKVKAIIPIAGLAADRSLMPDFPGLANSEKCSDWDTSIPIKMNLIRDKDEAYWKKYKGTPKAFISLETAQQIWSNRFGNLTMIRFAPEKGINPLEILQNSLKPSDFELAFQPVREKAVKSASNGVDFGGLFFGLSFFLLFSAFMLTTLLFIFGVESRCAEFPILESMGFSIREIRSLFLKEGTILAVIGALIGAPLGLLYNQAVLYFLGSVWQGAVGTTSLISEVNPATPFIGGFASVLIAWITMRIAIGKYTSKLYRTDFQKTVTTAIPVRIKWYLKISIALFVSGIAIVIMALLSKDLKTNTGIFFMCGGMLLISDWLCWRFCLDWFKKDNLLAESPTPFNLALKNTTSKPMRSMAAVILLSCGIFLTVAVAINKRTTPDPKAVNSGTGGYTFFIKTAIPLTHDMNTSEGKSVMGLDRELFKDVSFVNMSLSEGDNASCLNLNRVTRPAILGVDFAAFTTPERFTFTGTEKGISRENAWQELGAENRRSEVGGQRSEKTLNIETIPAVADEEVIMWSLRKSIGSNLEVNDETGKKHILQMDGALASSIFQGYVLIPKSRFHDIFPSVGGAKCLLVAAPEIKKEQVKTALADALIDYGAEITDCSSRLDEFYRVANTYLSIFLILGGLGILVGTAGFGAIVMRNITERRFELAIMNATGFSKQLIRKIVSMEHVILILAGCLSGVITALIAVLPTLYNSRSNPPYLLVLSLFVLILLCGMISVYIATWFATKGNTIPALRKE